MLVLNKNAKRDKGREAQLNIIAASKATADIVRTTLGPKAMLKMLLDPSGSVVLTNDGASILREIEVQHPAAMSIIELSRTQDERVGDGTTSVVVLAGELMANARSFLAEEVHPSRIVSAYRAAERDCIEILEKEAKLVDVSDTSILETIASNTLATKFAARFGKLLPKLAIDAVKSISSEESSSIDIRSLAKVEKVPGGEISDSQVLDGIMINKDVLHARMPRRIESPRILLLDTPIEYKKAESETNIEMKNPEDWRRYLDLEEQYVRKICESIRNLKPNVVVSEKGISDMAQHFLMYSEISVLRRVRKSDLHRLALATGARIGSDPSQMTEKEIGKNCGLFEVRKLGDEYWSFFEKCSSPKAVSVLLRGGSRDFLSEMERNFADASCAVRNLIEDPRVVPGAGAVELSLSASLRQKAYSKGDMISVRPYLAAASALEVIPKTLAQNCGVKVNRVIARLRAEHDAFVKGKKGLCSMGVDGETGDVADAEKMAVWESLSVKSQTIKTAFEAASMLLRIDDILSGVSKSSNPQQGANPPLPMG